VTYALALVLLVSIGYSLWVPLIFPGWVLAVSVYILYLNLKKSNDLSGGLVTGLSNRGLAIAIKI
jgi:hypothetical protein